jgi:hypothetical protein
MDLPIVVVAGLVSPRLSFGGLPLPFAFERRGFGPQLTSGVHRSSLAGPRPIA